MLAYSSLPKINQNVAIQLGQLFCIILWCCYCYCSTGPISTCMPYWDFITLPYKEQILSSNPVPKLKATNIEKHVHPNENIILYFYKERWVKSHPHCSLIVRNQLGSNL